MEEEGAYRNLLSFVHLFVLVIYACIDKLGINCCLGVVLGRFSCCPGWFHVNLSQARVVREERVSTKESAFTRLVCSVFS